MTSVRFTHVFFLVCSLLFGVSTARAASNLVTQNMARSPSSGAPGTVVNVTGTIRNIGATPAAASTANLRLSSSGTAHPTSSDPLLKSIAVPALAVNGTFTLDTTVTIPSSTPTSTKYIWAILDINSSAGQGSANETDDWSVVSFTVTAQPTYSDLVTQNLAGSPSSGAPGTVVSMTGTIRNIGTTPAAASTANFRLSSSGTSHPTGSDPLLRSIAVPALAVNGSHTINTTVTIPSGTPIGTRHIWVILDIDSSAGQGSANEGNDWSVVSFTVTAPPINSDLVTQNMARSPSSGAPGTAVNVTGTIRNIGTTPASASTANLRLSSSGTTHPASSDPLLGSISVPSLAVNGSYTIDTTLTIPSNTPISTRHIWLILDINSTAGQSSANEGNDWSAVSFAITGSSTLQVGQRVRAVDDGANVRTSALDAIRFTQVAGVHGTVIGGPLVGSAGGFTGNWWQIRWDSQPPSQPSNDGWSAESVLVAAPSAGDVPMPNFASAFYTTANIFWQAGFAPNSTSPPSNQLGDALGNCTWFAHGRLRELGYSPAQLNAMTGNANQWASQAISQGIAVDTTPSVGSIAQSVSQSLGHVAVVEALNGDGTITVTESSFVDNPSSAWNVLWRHRTVAPSWFDSFIHVSNTTTTCTYVLTPGSDTVSHSASAGSFGVATTQTCAWAAVSNRSWIQTTSSGVGNGSVAFAIDANPQLESRYGVITVGGRSFSIAQAGSCPADFDGNGAATVDDLFMYLNAWFTRIPAADVNGVGGITIDDLFYFLNAWFAGC